MKVICDLRSECFFVLKEWKDFCLQNLIERIKYNLSLSFILYISLF